MRIVIIEDEPLVASDIKNIVLRLERDINVVAVLDSVASAQKWFANHEHPDLILSDIQLSDGISFDIFQNETIQCPIIFTTAYNDYAIRAFKLNSIDYLLKPVDPVELKKALEKFRALSGALLGGDAIRQLISRWGKAHHQYKERFLVTHGNAHVPLHQDEIAFFHKDQLIFVHTMAQEKYLSEYAALDEIEDLIDPKVFFRVNRQYPVHFQAVGKIRTTHKGLSVMVKAPWNIELEVSREKAAAFKNWLT
jgi:two-component system, LytTR family, response regulator